jgi:hypothetical protein
MRYVVAVVLVLGAAGCNRKAPNSPPPQPPTTAQATPKAAVGGACTSNTDCPDDTRCVQDRGQRVCRPTTDIIKDEADPLNTPRR